MLFRSGFEIFHGDETKFDRKAHLKYTPLPGGEKAIREPWRNAAGMLIGLLGVEGEAIAAKLFPNKKTELAFLKTMIDKNINSPLAGTCGRLFDAVSAICGVCEISSYDGEAAIKLSELVDSQSRQETIYPFGFFHEHDLLSFDFGTMLKHIANEIGRAHV